MADAEEALSGSETDEPTEGEVTGGTGDRFCTRRRRLRFQ